MARQVLDKTGLGGGASRGERARPWTASAGRDRPWRRAGREALLLGAVGHGRERESRAEQERRWRCEEAEGAAGSRRRGEETWRSRRPLTVEREGGERGNG